jgi:hypothetical protein
MPREPTRPVSLNQAVVAMRGFEVYCRTHDHWRTGLGA